jgi:SWI/SNF-related matrix-associated actin-dependent regulator of chromatin subfamily B member 1
VGAFAEMLFVDRMLMIGCRTAIAHSIREQVQTYQKSLFLVGHPSDGSAVQDEDLRFAFLPSLSSAARPSDQVPSFTPLLNYLSDGEIERNEKERDKDMNRRRKRNTRGRRGIALPDREPIRTYRTPSIGFPELDAATLALAAAANAPMSRRAAAAAASVTIANMVASENGTAFLPQMPSTTMAPQPPPMAVKEKKTAKGHFKAPPFPQTVLRPRAQVVAPTPSTAADMSTLPPPLENDPPPAPPPMSSAASGGASTSDSKAVKIITAKRAKELEREAKEKEFADGQHANFIDGVWHCSNCGCPENIAIGRRKGPLGDKSQCGTCGLLMVCCWGYVRVADGFLLQANSGIDIDGLGLSSITPTPTSITASSEMRRWRRRLQLPRSGAELLLCVLKVELCRLRLQKRQRRRHHHVRMEMSRFLLANRPVLVLARKMIGRFRRCLLPRVLRSLRLRRGSK